MKPRRLAEVNSELAQINLNYGYETWISSAQLVFYDESVRWNGCGECEPRDDDGK